MVTKKLINLFGISIPLFIIHGLEEYFNGLYNIDSHVKFMFGYFQNMSSLQSSFLLLQIMLWVLLVISFLLLKQKGIKILLIFLGLVYIYELHHIIKAIEVGGYYPGLITGLGFPLIGYFYWRELISTWNV